MGRMASETLWPRELMPVLASFFRAHSAQLGDVGVLVGLSGDECCELCRRIADGLRALSGDALANRRIAQGLHGRLMELLSDSPGHARRCEETKPVGDVDGGKLRSELGKGWRVRQQGRAFGTSDGDRYMACNGVLHGRSGPTVSHMPHVNAGTLLEKFAGQMLRA